VIQSEQGRLLMIAGPDNKVAPRPVQAGEWYGKDWVILGGLEAGDKVIVDNLMKLRPGAPVMPHAPGEMPAGMGGPGKPAPKG
jgi:membrane fusion protein (multidrug efflux system)